MILPLICVVNRLHNQMNSKIMSPEANHFSGGARILHSYFKVFLNQYNKTGLKQENLFKRTVNM